MNRALLLASALSVGCAPPKAAHSEPPTAELAAASPALADASTELSDVPFVEFAVPGHEPAVVSLPSSPGRRPLLVAAHGAWDRPEPHCRLWRRVTEARAFVLCPRGKRTNVRTPPEHAAYYYPDHLALRREVLAGIQALSARYPDRVDTEAAVWAGFSQGAIHGALVVALDPKQFPRAALVEGGNGFFDEWSPFAARRYAAAGGERVLFGCGSLACVRTAERCASYLGGATVATRVVHAEGAGHSYGPRMEQELRESFAWLVADDPRWRDR